MKWMQLIFSWLVSLAFLTTGLAACSPPFHDQKTGNVHDVWLSKWLRLDDYFSTNSLTSKKIDDVLKNQLDARWNFSVEVKIPDSNKTVDVGSCRDFFSADRHQAETAKAYEYSVYRSIGTSCEAVKVAIAMKPSKNSFVRNLAIDENLPKMAPHQLALVISTEESKRLDANPDMHYWSDVEKIDSVQKRESDIFLFKTPGATHKITRLAYGDTNADGIEDLLLRDDVSLDEGSYTSSRLFILTRSSPNSRLKLLMMYPDNR